MQRRDNAEGKATEDGEKKYVFVLNFQKTALFSDELKLKHFKWVFNKKKKCLGWFKIIFQIRKKEMRETINSYSAGRWVGAAVWARDRYTVAC